jgi:hypothetical protein
MKKWIKSNRLNLTASKITVPKVPIWHLANNQLKISKAPKNSKRVENYSENGSKSWHKIYVVTIMNLSITKKMYHHHYLDKIECKTFHASKILCPLTLDVPPLHKKTSSYFTYKWTQRMDRLFQFWTPSYHGCRYKISDIENKARLLMTCIWNPIYGIYN